MVSIVTKKINGRAYLYLVESVRNKTKVVQKTIKYIGKKRPVSKHELNCMSLSYKREDWVLKTFQEYLSYQDHELLKNASENQYEYLKTLDKISREKQKEKFLSQFISDSNAIEGSTLSTKDTFNYLFNDITPTGHNKKELFMAHNLLKAWEYVEKNKKRLPTKKDLLILHKLVNMDIEENKTLGKFKNIQNYVGDVYTTSFLFTEERLGELLRWIRKAFRKINDFEVAFQSHAQFEIIHPFVDGNGRVGRLLINWLLMYKKKGYFAIRAKKRNEYISALFNSQKGKVEAICKFCFKEYVHHNSFL